MKKMKTWQWDDFEEEGSDNDSDPDIFCDD